MQQTIENGIIVFSVSISRWSANKKLRQQHTKAREEDLPPADLASLGVRKVFDPKILAPFEAIRKETERLCFNEGTRFFGGVAVPKTEADDFTKKLKALQQRFAAEKAAFAKDYEANLDAWRAAHLGWENVLEGALSVDDALHRFSYGFSAVEIVMTGAQETATTELGQTIVSSQGAFIGQMYAEIAQMATTYRKDSLLGKEAATTRGLSSLQTMKKKLNGLAFLDKRIRPLVEMIEKVMAEMPATGSIDGTQFATLLGVTSILSDQDLMQQYGDQVASGQDATSLFKSLVAPPITTQAVTVPTHVMPAPSVFKPGVVQFNKPSALPANSINQGVKPPVTGWGFIPSRVAVAA